MEPQNQSFQYTYSAKEQAEIQRIRKKYVSHEESSIEKLRRLDAGVTKKASAYALAIGIVGALLLGLGMSLAMTELGTWVGLGVQASMFAGIAVGIIGIALVALAYPLYNRVVKKEREKIAPEVLRLTDELMK